MDKLFFAENLRHLREEHLKAKQADIPSITGFSRSTWSGYERGASLPSLSDLIKLCGFFGLSEYDLLHTDLATNLPKINITDDNLVVAMGDSRTAGKTAAERSITGKMPATQKNAVDKKLPPIQADNYGVKTPAIITINDTGIENIIYVPVKARAGYLSGYGDKEFIESLPSFRMPGLGNNTYRMFEVDGLSMSPTLSDRDRVIAEWVPAIADIRENRVHVIVHKDGVAVKRLLNRAEERGTIYLKSDTIAHRADYPLKEISVEDVIEIWYVRLKVSGDLPEPTELYARVADLEINQHEILKKLNLTIESLKSK